MIETVVFVLAVIIGLLTVSLPWLAMDWWEANRRNDDRERDDES